MLVADLPDALEVALLRRDAAAGVLQRLEDHGGDRVGALEHRSCGGSARRPRGGRAPRASGTRSCSRTWTPPGMDGSKGVFRLGQPGRRERSHRGAVVGDLASDDLVLLALAVGAVEVARDLDRRLDRLRPGVREEDPVEVAGGQLGDALGELDRPRMGVAPVRIEVELLDLRGGGLRVLGPAVTRVAAEQRGETVEVALAVVVPDVGALGLGDDRNLVVGVVTAHPGKVHPEVLAGRRPAGPTSRNRSSGARPAGS